jgi:hypothetical protein
MSIQRAFESFINGNDFQSAVEKSTSAGFGGSGYSVELFEDGTYRILWDNEIGNLYMSDGIILSIPQYNDDTLQDIALYGNDADLSFELDEIRAMMQEAFLYHTE